MFYTIYGNYFLVMRNIILYWFLRLSWIASFFVLNVSIQFLLNYIIIQEYCNNNTNCVYYLFNLSVRSFILHILRYIYISIIYYIQYTTIRFAYLSTYLLYTMYMIQLTLRFPSNSVRAQRQVYNNIMQIAYAL